jgi:predicted nucleotide-binding protein
VNISLGRDSINGNDFSIDSTKQSARVIINAIDAVCEYFDHPTPVHVFRFMAHDKFREKILAATENPLLQMFKEQYDEKLRRFVRDREGTFRRWLETFRPDGCLLYRRLMEGRDEGEPEGTALAILSYHCVIDESGPGGVSIGSTIFRDWFRLNYRVEGSAVSVALEPAKIRSQPLGKRIFVVHGRDVRLRNSLFTFLRSLGLEPLDSTALVEATGNPSPQINEILKVGFKISHSAVVLLSPDDEARLREEFRTPDDPECEIKLSPQPRANVLFEAGMAIASFPERTVLVQAGWSRPFSDIAGMHMVKIDNSVERRRDLANRLRMAGCEVSDLNMSIDWQTVGDFSPKRV